MRNFHSLYHEHKLSVDMGTLVPIATMEVLPGDTFIHSTNVLARVAPLANPVMHSVDLRVHHWYVPDRILWASFEDWITGADDVSTHPVITIPASATDWALMDHMGIPQDVGFDVNALPIRAYNMIYNEFYRDKDLQTARTEDQLGLARICWGKDYFTTARPYPQQGDTNYIPFDFAANNIDVQGIYAGASWPAQNIYDPDGTLHGNDEDAPLYAHAPSQDGNPTSGFTVPYIAGSDISGAGGIDVNDLRQAIALQRFAEARMKFGEQYVDYLRFLGVNPSDGRLSRPEYLGGGSQRINFSEVIATADSGLADVGDLYGHGIVGLNGRRYRKMFEEHGWVLSLLSVRPKSVYSSAMPRKFTRSTAMEYWQKELEVMPWQEVKQHEVDAAGSTTTTFGYVPRYDEYRQEMSYVSGTFRGGTENDWHMAREFGTPPTLNSSFVECTPTDRIYQDTTMPELLVNVRHDIMAKRLVRKNATISSL